MKVSWVKFLAGLLVIVSGGFILSSFAPQEDDGGFLMVRTVEVASGFVESKVIIIDESGQKEEVYLDKLKANTVADNTIKINETINNIRKKGYELVSVTGGAGDAVFTNTYIFRKR